MSRMANEGIDIRANRVDEIACGQCSHVINVSRLPVFSSLNCPKCGSKLTVPALLGNFLLLEELGAGGMGSVYRGLDQALGRFVAIKVMKRSLGADDKLVDSFLREARTAATLNHPNIVQIYSCGHENGQPYIAMELVSGNRLDQMMADGKSVKETRLLEIALDVSEGLKAANGVGLVHGDIKPANILTDKNGTAKVVDFGLAQFVNAQQQSGEVWGTPFYISPERARGAAADHRSDIYSLGATLFHALTGKPPFDGKTATDVVLARLKEPAPDIRDFNPNLQPETAMVIGRMLESDTARRYPTSASLQADLRAALAAARDAEKHGGHRPVEKKPSAGPKIAIAAVIGLLSIGGLAALVISSRKESKPPPPPVVVAPEREVTGETFFADDAEQRIISAAADLTGGQIPKCLVKLDRLAAEVPRNSARAAWIRLLRVIPLWVAARAPEATEELKAVAVVKVNQPDDHPVHMPLVLARFILHEMDEAEFEKRVQAWPPWYRNATLLFRGLNEFQENDFLKGTLHLQTYAASDSKMPAWVYSFQPAAAKWLDLATRWEGVKRESNRLAGENKTTDAVAQLERFLFECPPFMRPPVDAEIQRLKGSTPQAAAPAAASPGAAPAPAAAGSASPGENQIGTWAPADLKGRTSTTNDFDVTALIKTTGAYTVRFQFSSGSASLEVDSVALLANDREIARDAHFGSASKDKSDNVAYKLTLPTAASGTRYVVRISWHTDGGRSSRGRVYLSGP